MRECGNRKGFTLIELLVVIAIIAVLAAILFPVFGAARQRSQQISCLNNVKQMGYGLLMYAGEYSDTLIPMFFWDQDHRMHRDSSFGYNVLIQPYIKSQNVFHCPADNGVPWWPPSNPGDPGPRRLWEHGSYQSSYIFNAYHYDDDNKPVANIAGLKLAKLPQSAKVILVCDFSAITPFSWHQPRGRGSYIFNGAKNNLCFADGHAKLTGIYYNGMSQANTYPAEDTIKYGYMWMPWGKKTSPD